MLRVEPEILANYVAKGTVRLAFSHVLDHGKPSMLAHRTAECAGSQDPMAFWRMHDLLFERQDQLWEADPYVMVQFATELGLDGIAFEACLDDPAIVEKVERMDQARRDLGIRSRPSFVANDQLVQGTLAYATFANFLDGLLGK